MGFFANLYIEQGADFSKQFIAKDDNGTVIDLTGYTIRASLRKNYTTAAQTRFTAVIDDASAGKYTISLSNSQTDSLQAPRRYVYDILLEDASSPTTRRRDYEGQAVISPQVTNLSDFDSPNSP